MTNKTQILLAVVLPDDLCGPFLQHIRDFDMAHSAPALQFGISTRKNDEVIKPPSLPPLKRH